MSHPKSIWKSTSKYHVPTAPAVMKDKPFVVWSKGPYGDTGTCKTCQRTFLALHSSQKNLLSSIDGRCYFCRDMKDQVARPVTTTEKEILGIPNFPLRPITRDLWQRGGRGNLHSIKDTRRLMKQGNQNLKEGDEPSRVIHLGKLVTNQDDAQFTILAKQCSAAVNQQLQFPLWSCCFQKQRSQTCSKARSRFLLAEKMLREKELTEEESGTMAAPAPILQLPPPNLEQMLMTAEAAELAEEKAREAAEAAEEAYM